MAKQKKPKVKKLGGGVYLKTRGKRKGHKFRVGKGGTHVYKIKGRRVVVGGKKPAKPKKKVDPYKKDLDAAVSLEFGETDTQLERERRTSEQMSRNVGDWWSGYQRDVESARVRGQQGYQQAQQGVTAAATTARAQDQANSGLMDAEAQKAAALRGTTAGPNVAASAQASRNALNNSFGGLIASQGAAQNTYGANQVATAGGIRASELGKEAGRGRLIDEEKRKVAARKGSYRVAKRQELSDAAYKRRLEAAAFGLDVQKEATNAADKAADNKAGRRRDKATRRNQRSLGKDRDRRYQETKREHGRVEAERQWKRDHPTKTKAKGGGGKDGLLSPAKRVEYRDKYRTGYGLSKAYVKNGKLTKPYRKIHQALVAKGLAPDLARAAIQRAQHGGVDPGLAKKIKRDYGITVKTRKKKSKSRFPRGNPLDGTPG